MRYRYVKSTEVVAFSTNENEAMKWFYDKIHVMFGSDRDQKLHDMILTHDILTFCHIRASLVSWRKAEAWVAELGK